MTWVTGRIAVGGGIWSDDKMRQVAAAGVTHIVDMQIEFDDTALAEPYGIQVFWNRVDDDFQAKPPAVFQGAIEFAVRALEEPDSKVYIHCAAGVHRGPMMGLALLRVLGWGLEEAIDLIEARRPVVDFADVYVHSVENFVRTWELATRESEGRR